MTLATRTERVEAPPLALELVWRGDVLAEMHVCRSREDETQNLSETAAAFKAALEDYVSGREPAWPEPKLDFSGHTPFRIAVLNALRKHATYGKTVTYGQLAALAGSPRAARAVGMVMAKNRYPLLYPCHRVLGTNGALTGFSAEGGTATKADLLRLEKGAPARC